MRAWLSRLLMRPTPPPLLTGIVVAVICIVIETLLTYPVGLVVDGVSLGIVYVPGVLLVATMWGLLLGAATVVASVVTFSFFHFTSGRFTEGGTAEWMVLTVFLAVALLAGFVADLARSRAVEIGKRRRESELAAEFAHLLLRAEVESIQPGGDRWIGEVGRRAAGAAALDKEDLYVAALRDVTRRRRQERKLQSALEQQSSVVAIAAHELQNPLTAIRALTHTLRDPRYAGTAQQTIAIADRIGQRAEALQGLVRKLLTASRLDARPGRGSPGRVLVRRHVLELLAEPGVASRPVHVAGNPALEALVDRGEFSEMLVNYLDNASIHGAEPFEVRVAERDGWIEVRVCDGGPGVPEEFRPRLFERFSRGPDAARYAEGSGLGLWIVRSLARANGGDAFYEPGPSGGACFGLRLPQAPPP